MIFQHLTSYCVRNAGAAQDHRLPSTLQVHPNKRPIPRATVGIIENSKLLGIWPNFFYGAMSLNRPCSVIRCTDG